MRPLATSAARFGFDWLSRTMISSGCFVPPMSSWPPVAALICSSVQGSCSEKIASGPVSGATSPILIVFGAAKATRGSAVAASAAAPVFRNARRPWANLVILSSLL